MKNIRNLTPHAINIILDDGNAITIEPEGIIARVSVSTASEGSINGIPITVSVFGEVENLPDSNDTDIFIVSSIVASRVPDRRDIFIPNESVRDEKGRIIGCKSLGRI